MKRLILTLVAAVLLAATSITTGAVSAAPGPGGILTLRTYICEGTPQDLGECVQHPAATSHELLPVAGQEDNPVSVPLTTGDGGIAQIALAPDTTWKLIHLDGFSVCAVSSPTGDLDIDGNIVITAGHEAVVDAFACGGVEIDGPGPQEPEVDLAGAIHVAAYACPAGVEPQDPDGWAAACTNPINGMPFTLSGVDDVYFEETRVTGQEIVGTTVFPGLTSAAYSLSKGPFDKQALGFWSCDTAAEYGADGYVAFQLDAGQETFCAYYFLSAPDAPDAPVADDAPDAPNDQLVVALPDTGSGETAGPDRDAGFITLAATVGALIALSVLAAARTHARA